MIQWMRSARSGRAGCAAILLAAFASSGCSNIDHGWQHEWETLDDYGTIWSKGMSNENPDLGESYSVGARQQGPIDFWESVSRGWAKDGRQFFDEP